MKFINAHLAYSNHMQTSRTNTLSEKITYFQRLEFGHPWPHLFFRLTVSFEIILILDMDANWFFSSLTQSAAALIGIIGGFVISKLLGQSEKTDFLISTFKHLVVDRDSLLKRIKQRNFKWYNRISIEQSEILKIEIKEGSFANKNDWQRLKKLYKIMPNIFRHKSNLPNLNAMIRKFESNGRIPDIMFEAPVLNTMKPPDFYKDLQAEYDSIIGLKIESETIISKFKVIKEDIYSTKKYLAPIRNTIYILMIAFIFTVIYPLHFMPVKIDTVPNIEFTFAAILENIISLRGILLTTLFIIINGLFVYFIFIIRKINCDLDKYANKLKSEYFNLYYYSKYF